MKLSRRTLIAGLAASSFGAHLAEGSVAAQSDTGNLRLALNTSDLATLDPHYTSASMDRATIDLFFNGLVRFKPGDSSQFEPDLAEEMPEATTNDDGTQTWTFKLRQGVKTHPTAGADSADLTVDDVLFSFEKAANPDTSTYAWNYTDWKFAKGDDGTFQITVPAPLSETLFLPHVANYSGGYIIPKAAYEAVGADAFPTNPVGTGPFVFQSHTPQQNIITTAHADYFRGAPKLSGVEIRYMPDGTSRELALQSGDIDVMYGLADSTWVDSMNQNPDVVAETFGVGEVFFISLNVESEDFKDVRVREAVMKAINGDDFVAYAGGEPVGVPVYSVVPDTLMPGGLTAEESEAAGVSPTIDLDRAKELLKEAGKESGMVLDLVTSEQESYVDSYELIAEQLRQIGIDVKLEVVQHAAMHELIRQGRNSLVLYQAFRPTADVYLTQFFTTVGGVTNFSHFTVDDLRDQARAETDPDAQAEIWKQANIEILKNFAGKGLAYTNQVFGRRKNVNYGHELISVVQCTPGIDETTSFSE